MSGSGKRKKKSQASERLFDTSRCQVKFRKPRILERRNRSFDQDRELTFDHERVIHTRLQGVIFRDRPKLDFKNSGVANVEEVSNKQDWPDVGPAKTPDALQVKRSADWEQTWGKVESFEQRWSVDRRKVEIRPDQYVYSRDRTQPRLTYIIQRKENQRTTPLPPENVPVKQQPIKQPSRTVHHQTPPKPKPKHKPKAQVVFSADICTTQHIHQCSCENIQRKESYPE